MRQTIRYETTPEGLLETESFDDGSYVTVEARLSDEYGNLLRTTRGIGTTPGPTMTYDYSCFDRPALP